MATLMSNLMTRGLSRFGSTVGKSLSRSGSNASTVSALSSRSTGSSVSRALSNGSAAFPISRAVPVRQPEFIHPATTPASPQSAQVSGALRRSNAFRDKSTHIPNRSPSGSPTMGSDAVKPPPLPPKPPAYQNLSENHNLEAAFRNGSPAPTKTYQTYQPPPGHAIYSKSYSPPTGNTGAYQAYQPYRPPGNSAGGNSAAGSHGTGGNALPYPVTPSPQGTPAYQSASQLYKANNPPPRTPSPDVYQPKPVSGSYQGSTSGFTATQNSGAEMRGALNRWESQLYHNPGAY